MKELWNILWVDGGWAKMTPIERIKMLYFTLSLSAVAMMAEGPLWLILILVANFCVSAKVVRTIKTDIPDE